MTLKDKFKLPIDANNKINDYVAEQCEKIADKFAIQFLEFVHVNCEEDWGSDNYLYNEESYTIKEILKMFKKERDL